MLVKMGLDLSRWQSQKKGDREHFMETLFGRLLDLNSSNESFVSYLNSEKNKSEKNYSKDVRVAAASDVLSFLADMAAINIELADLRLKGLTRTRFAKLSCLITKNSLEN
jgi:hypothetical protein